MKFKYIYKVANEALEKGGYTIPISPESGFIVGKGPIPSAYYVRQAIQSLPSSAMYPELIGSLTRSYIHSGPSSLANLLCSLLALKVEIEEYRKTGYPNFSFNCSAGICNAVNCYELKFLHYYWPHKDKSSLPNHSAKFINYPICEVETKYTKHYEKRWLGVNGAKRLQLINFDCACIMLLIAYEEELKKEANL